MRKWHGIDYRLFRDIMKANEQSRVIVREIFRTNVQE